MSSPVRRALPASRPLPAAAAAIREAFHARLPDFSGITVLLPTLRAAPPLARELAAASGVAVLLLPRLATLPDWAASVPVAAPQVPDSLRELDLYGALRERGWFRDPDLWHVVGELRRLADELTRHRVALPESAEDLAAKLETAYRAKAGEPLRFEARLVHEAWRILAAVDGPLDGVSRYHLQLRHLAQSVSGPIVAVGLDQLTPAETEFLDRCAARVPVLALDAEARDESLPRLLEAAWPPRTASESRPDLRTRAQAFAAGAPQSPAHGRVALCGAGSLEQEARVAETQVRSWLLAGKERIAVVAQDRLAARRLRALLERAQVLVEDETGWTLSTVAATTVVMRLLDCVAGDFYHQDVLDLLKSPLVFGDLEADARKQAVHGIEHLVRTRNVIGGLPAVRAAARGQDLPAEGFAVLDRLEGAAKRLALRSAPLGLWLDRLHEALTVLGAAQTLEADAAGRQLLDLLGRLRREVGTGDPKMKLSEWRRWLDRRLEDETFRDREVKSPVVFTHLAAARLRSFDGAVLLGCDAVHFPGRSDAGLFFNQAVRRELGLPGRDDELEQVRRDLTGLIARSGEVLVTWQRQLRGEENLVSPLFELLDAFHRLAYGATLMDGARLAALPYAELRPVQEDAPLAARAPAPAPAAPALLSASVSVSAWGSLIACPYQFFARHLLKLNELDEVREDVDKRDYGEILHGILKRFHDSHPVFSASDPETLAAQLSAESESGFAPCIEANYLAHAWLTRWKALIPAYVAWQREREAQGWRYAEGEAARAAELGPVALRGRLDRVDRRETAAGAEFAVLDYKTQSAQTLKARVEPPGEDAQLPSYALLQGAVSETAFLSLDKDKPRPVAPKLEPAELAARERERLTAVFSGVRAGAPLPAQGDDRTCAWCEMQGLCRRAYWP
ncbi:MAG: PD-(D/E)XK nuclease family protein [Betaproteobacteria bacterium]|nr:PD-(D/E)XK nuclease family protein [Betaproteobacteria bacterium]